MGVMYPGVELATISFGAAKDFFGDDTKGKITVVPLLGGSTKTIVWDANGRALVPFVEVKQAEVGVEATLQLPVVNQDGWRDDAGNVIKMWAYRLTYYAESSDGTGSVTIEKVFQPLKGQSIIDFDRILGTGVGAPLVAAVPAVTSVNGQTGAVTVSAGGLPAGSTDNEVLTWSTEMSAPRWEPAPSGVSVISTAKTGTELPSTYPQGISILEVGDDSTWPAKFATVETVRAGTNRSFQTLVERTTAKSWRRTPVTGDTGWNAWLEFGAAGTGGGSSITLPIAQSDVSGLPAALTAKLNTISTASRLYGTAGAGVQSSYNLSKTASGDSVPQRTSTGQLLAAEATTDDALVTRGQMSAAVGTGTGTPVEIVSAEPTNPVAGRIYVISTAAPAGAGIAAIVHLVTAEQLAAGPIIAGHVYVEKD
jgi:hypothetical protein